jgi:hypothetical protein
LASAKWNLWKWVKGIKQFSEFMLLYPTKGLIHRKMPNCTLQELRILPNPKRGTASCWLLYGTGLSCHGGQGGWFMVIFLFPW